MGIRAVKTYVFYCSNNLEAGLFSSLSLGHAGDSIRTISLPCSGKVDIPYLVKAFENGADGVVIVTCSRNECRHFEGSLRAHRRAEAVESLLEEIGVAAGRMAVFECVKDNPALTMKEIELFMERVRIMPEAFAARDTTGRQESTVE